MLAAALLAGVFLSCSDLFENRIAMSANTGSLVKLVVPEEEIEKLDAPAQIFVSQADFPDRINISWSAVPGATSYRLERAVSTEKDAAGNFIPPDDGEFDVLPLCQRLYNTTHTDIILKDPSYLSEEYSYRYYYRVSAENPRLKYESSDFTKSEEAFLLAPPSNVMATLGEHTDKIGLTWDKAENALYYDVYRSQNSDGSSSVLIQTVFSNQNFCENTIDVADQGKDFYYTVRTRTNTSSSVTSGIALGYALKGGAPGKVTDVKVVDKQGRGDTTDSISISWASTAGAEQYAVYRTSSRDSSYTLLGNTTSLTFPDKKSLQPNVYYYYQVQAFKMEGDEKVKGPFSDSGRTSKNPAEGFILSAPANISVVKASNGGCIVEFSAALGSRDCPDDSKLSAEYNDYTYKIYQSENKDSGFTEISGITIPECIGGFYRVENVPTAKFYKVSTCLGAVESEPSAVCAPAPDPARDLEVSKAQYIAGYTDSDSDANEMGVYPVKLTWTASADADGGYFVYRSTNADTGFKKITDEPVMKTEYIDKNENAKAGVYYYYKVLSLNTLLQGSNYTTAKSGWGALTPRQYMLEYNKTIINSQKKLTLMHKSPDTAKLGSESANGDLSGSLSYNASLAGLGARITMHYSDYADFYANNNPDNGYYFLVTGDTNTSASMDASGSMDGTVVCKGMYPGSVGYNNIQIKGGGAGGGVYVISREGFPGSMNVEWTVGEEGK